MLIIGPTFSGFLRGRVEISAAFAQQIDIDIDACKHTVRIPRQTLEVSGMAQPKPRITVERVEI